MKVSGIYKIQSQIKPERIYIGSSINIKRRWDMHLLGLRKNKHHSQKLQNHFNKYGLSDIEFIVLLGCEKEELIKNEQFFIDSYKPYFNILPNAGSHLGFKFTDESRKRISDSKKGNKNALGCKRSEETKYKMSISKSGLKLSDETKKKQSEVKKGIKLKPEHIQHIKDALKTRSPEVLEKIKMFCPKGKEHYLFGKKLSDETKQKIRLANLGKESPRKGCKLSDETKIKIGLASKGRKASEETRKKMSERMKKQIAWNTGKHLSIEHRQKLSKLKKGIPKPLGYGDKIKEIWRIRKLNKLLCNAYS